MLYPLHMMRDGGFGGVLLSDYSHGSHVAIKETSQIAISGSVYSTTIKFE